MESLPYLKFKTPFPRTERFMELISYTNGTDD